MAVEYATVSNNALIPATTQFQQHEMSIQLLNKLLIFYQQRRGWVQRSRASLELAYVQGPLLVAPSMGGPSGSQSDSDGSALTDCSSESTTNEPTPAGSFGGNSYDEAVVKEEEDEDSHLTDRSQNLTPLTLRAKYAARAPSSRWLKRKQSFKLRLGPFSNQLTTRPPPRSTGPDPKIPTVQCSTVNGVIIVLYQKLSHFLTVYSFVIA